MNTQLPRAGLETSSAGDADPQRYVARLQPHIAAGISRAVALYAPVLQEHLRRGRPPGNIESFISILQSAVERRAGVGTPEFVAYLNALVEVVTNLVS